MSLQAFFKKGGGSAAGGEKAPAKKSAGEKAPPKNIPWVEKYRPKVRVDPRILVLAMTILTKNLLTDR